MIVLINPNSTVSMTQAMQATARDTRPDIEIQAWTSHDGPAAIQGRADGEASVPPLLKLVQRASDQGASAIIIGCFDDTGLTEARTTANCPVIGIGQAAYHLAALAGARFSVVTTLDVSIPVLAENIETYGLSGNLARLRASGVPVLALETDPDAAAKRVLQEIIAAQDQDNIASVVLGCAGMSHIPSCAGPEVKVRLIDGVRAAVHLGVLL